MSKTDDFALKLNRPKAIFLMSILEDRSREKSHNLIQKRMLEEMHAEIEEQFPMGSRTVSDDCPLKKPWPTQ
jgi:hypothetical protein